MPGCERGISVKNASRATLAAGHFYIGAEPDRQFNRALNTSGLSMKGTGHLRTRSLVRYTPEFK
jgi:hypothetical protein